MGYGRAGADRLLTDNKLDAVLLVLINAFLPKTPQKGEKGFDVCFQVKVALSSN